MDAEQSTIMARELAVAPAGARIAAVDVGSNSVRLVVAEVLPSGGYRVLDEERENTRLAASLTKTGRLDPAAANATIGVLRRNAALLGVSRVTIFGNSTDGAVRELLRQLPRLGLQAALAQDSSTGTVAGAPRDTLWLYFPEEWAALDWSSRMEPHAVVAHLGWAAGPLAGVAREQGWVGR